MGSVAVKERLISWPCLTYEESYGFSDSKFRLFNCGDVWSKLIVVTGPCISVVVLPV